MSLIFLIKWFDRKQKLPVSSAETARSTFSAETENGTSRRGYKISHKLSISILLKFNWRWKAKSERRGIGKVRFDKRFRRRNREGANRRKSWIAPYLRRRKLGLLASTTEEENNTAGFKNAKTQKILSWLTLLSVCLKYSSNPPASPDSLTLLLHWFLHLFILIKH